MTFTVAQRQRAIGLYKRLLRTSRKTFEGDAVAITAARNETRHRFKIAAQETDATKIYEGLKMGDEIVSVLRQNVVQGKFRADKNAYGKLNRSKIATEYPETGQIADYSTLYSPFFHRTSHDQGYRTRQQRQH